MRSSPIEYYMETLQAGRADQWHMLDGAEARLAEIEPTGRVIPLAGEPAGGRRRTLPRDRRRVPTRLRDASGAGAASPSRPRSAGASSCRLRHVGPAPAPASAASRLRPCAATTVDPEFVALFVEEARENVTRLNELFPRWEQNPLDAEALRDVRRAFHTLKGSGRMVGARRVGEFSWSIEIAAEPRDQPDAGAIARHRRRGARRGGSHAAADRRNRWRRDGCRPTSTQSWRAPMRCRDARPRRCRPRPLPTPRRRRASPARTPMAVEHARPMTATATARRPLTPRRRRRGRRVDASARVRISPGTQQAARLRDDGSGAARDLPQGDRRTHPGRAPVHRALRAQRGAAPDQRSAVSRLPHPERHREDGGRAPGHQGRRTDGALRPQAPRQRSWLAGRRRRAAAGHGAAARNGFGARRRTHRLFSRNRAASSPAGTHSTARSTRDLARLASAAERTLAGVWTPSADSGSPTRPRTPTGATVARGARRIDRAVVAEPGAGRRRTSETCDATDPDHTAPHEALIERSDRCSEPSSIGAPKPPGRGASSEPEPTARGPEPTLCRRAGRRARYAVSVTARARLVDRRLRRQRRREFDADIAAIFGEEATELLEQSEAAFSRWRRDRADGSQVTELKRLLHTLKGGARMAGIRAMGDVSHEVESLLAAIEIGAVHADGAALDVLQDSLDELHRMRETGQFRPAHRAARCTARRIRECRRQRVARTPSAESYRTPARIERLTSMEPRGAA